MIFANFCNMDGEYELELFYTHEYLTKRALLGCVYRREHRELRQKVKCKLHLVAPQV